MGCTRVARWDGMAGASSSACLRSAQSCARPRAPNTRLTAQVRARGALHGAGRQVRATGAALEAAECQLPRGPSVLVDPPRRATEQCCSSPCLEPPAAGPAPRVTPLDAVAAGLRMPGIRRADRLSPGLWGSTPCPAAAAAAGQGADAAEPADAVEAGAVAGAVAGLRPGGREHRL